MSHELSPQSQQYLEEIVSGGLYPSTGAALDAAIEALREKNQQVRMVPPEHIEMVERAIEQADAGLVSPMTADDWTRLRESAQKAANEKR